MAECGGRAVPGAGAELNQKLAGIQMGLSKPPITPGLLSDATDQVNAELSAWAERAFQHHQENEREIREIIGAVARAAESVGDRGEKYTKEIGELAAHLRGIADLEDIALIRRSIVESTKALKTCVEKIAQESRHSVEDLSSQIVEYRRRLKESEKISTVDSLTELANRRSFEREMEVRISLERPFCLVMIDMNNFKGVNDRYGHIAGDDLLRQFAMELRGQFTDADLVARWGGDEFVVIASGNLQEGKARVERVQRWVLGEYKINTGAGAAKVPVERIDRNCPVERPRNRDPVARPRR